MRSTRTRPASWSEARSITPSTSPSAPSRSSTVRFTRRPGRPCLPVTNRRRCRAQSRRRRRASLHLLLRRARRSAVSGDGSSGSDPAGLKTRATSYASASAQFGKLSGSGHESIYLLSPFFYLLSPDPSPRILLSSGGDMTRKLSRVLLTVPVVLFAAVALVRAQAASHAAVEKQIVSMERALNDAFG